LSVEEKEQVRMSIKQLLDANIIRPSSFHFASPMLLVKKKNGTDRLCVDDRELNANIISDKYQLPHIVESLPLFLFDADTCILLSRLLMHRLTLTTETVASIWRAEETALKHFMCEKRKTHQS